MFDMHTRLFGTTNLSAALPPWALEGDTATIAKRLRDSTIRRELKEYRSILTALARGDWSRIVVFDSPTRMVGSDATALAPDGPLAESSFHGAYTWAAWWYRHYARETRRLTPQEAIRRITALPAQRLGLRDRGVIRKGAYADLAIFDPETFAERGTTFAPNQLATGMQHLLINGAFALRDGRLTGARSGRVLRK